MRNASGMTVVVLVNADIATRVDDPSSVLLSLADKEGVHRALLLALQHRSPNRQVLYTSGCTGCQGNAAVRAAYVSAQDWIHR